MKTAVVWALRVAIALTFIGHGYFALTGRVQWLSYLMVWGFSIETAQTLLPIIGWLDQIIALLILFYPHRIVVLWAVFWTVATAISRPLAGEHFMEFIERGSNIGAPIALYILLYSREKKNENSSIHPELD
jgi:hypothetical protein